MNILLTNQVIGDFTGTDTCTRTIAKYLVRAGHTVYVWSPRPAPNLQWYTHPGATIVPDLESLARLDVDIGHIHHSPCLLMVRKLKPELPLLFLSHGVIPPEEIPPPGMCNVARVLCVSWEVQNWLKKMGTDPHLLYQWNYPINPDIFNETIPPQWPPKRALVLSERIKPDQLRAIAGAAAALGITVQHYGKPGRRINQLEVARQMNAADIVFTIGRGVVESLFCGRPPFIFDYLGGDGFLTPGHFLPSKHHNYSGRSLRHHFTAHDVRCAIRCYHVHHLPQVSAFAHAHHDAAAQVSQLVTHYEQVLDPHKNDWYYQLHD